MKVADVQQPNKEITGKEDNARIVQAISREKKKSLFITKFKLRISYNKNHRRY